MKSILTVDGKTGVLKVNTNVLVGLRALSRKTLILRTAVTPCSFMNSRICSSVCLFRAGHRTIPLETFNQELGITVHLTSQNFFILRRFFSCGSLAHCMSISPDLRFFYTFGSPATLMIVLCIKKGEREEISFPSSSE